MRPAGQSFYRKFRFVYFQLLEYDETAVPAEEASGSAGEERKEEGVQENAPSDKKLD